MQVTFELLTTCVLTYLLAYLPICLLPAYSLRQGFTGEDLAYYLLAYYLFTQGFTGEDLAYYLLAYYLFTQGFTGEDRQLETDAARVKEEQQLEPYNP